MTAKKHKDNLLWLDMEMTGLDPERERIIEIATIITDKDLNILGEGPDLVIHQSDKLLKAMDSWNKRQHGGSGLIEEIRRSRISEAHAEEATLKFVRRFCYKGKVPLCGNSIHHDRRFLIRYMPRLNRYLHYQHIDVSTIKGLVRRWYKRNKSIPKKKEAHRALADIRESIDELKFYRQTYFKSLPAGRQGAE